MRRLGVIPVLLLAGAASAQSRSGEAVVEPEGGASAWRVRAEINAWRPALQGDLGLPGAPATDVENLKLDENEFAPSGAVYLRKEDWTLELSGFVLESDVDAGAGPGFTLGSVTVGAGAPFEAEVDYASAQAILTKRAWSKVFNEDVSLRLDVGGGVRVYDARIEASSGGARATGDLTWFDVVGTAKLETELPHDLTFDMFIDAGGMSLGDASSFSWSVGARLVWQPEPWLGAQLGYRWLRTDAEEDESGGGTAFDGAAAGLYVGLTLRY